VLLDVSLFTTGYALSALLVLFIFSTGSTFTVLLADPEVKTASFGGHFAISHLFLETDTKNMDISRHRSYQVTKAISHLFLETDTKTMDISRPDYDWSLAISQRIHSLIALNFKNI